MPLPKYEFVYELSIEKDILYYIKKRPVVFLFTSNLFHSKYEQHISFSTNETNQHCNEHCSLRQYRSQVLPRYCNIVGH